MQRISLDERSARRIASARMRSNFSEMLERAVVLRKEFPSRGGNAEVRRAYSLERNFFGDGWIGGHIEGRHVLAIGITVVDDRETSGDERYALFGVANNTRSKNIQRAALMIFSGHAVARAMQRTGYVNPEKALAIACSAIDIETVFSNSIDKPEGHSVEVATATGTLHCVLESGLLLCKTFIDAPGQGPGPLNGEA